MSERVNYQLIRGLMVDEGSRSLTLSVVAILDPSPNYPDSARIIVGSTPGSEARLAFHGDPATIRKLAQILAEAADDAERAKKGGATC